MMMMTHQQLVYSSKIINQMINMFLLILRLTNSLSWIAAYKIEIYLFHMSCSSWVYLSVLFIYSFGWQSLQEIQRIYKGTYKLQSCISERKGCYRNNDIQSYAA
jgi:hypothetical protein